MRVIGTNSEDRSKPNAGLRSEASLRITAGAFPDEALLLFVEDCIVPALVNRFLQDRFKLQDSIRREHNEAHL